MNRIIEVTALITTVILLASTAAAEQSGHWFRADDEFNRPGFYVGLNAIYATNSFSDDVEDVLNDQVAANNTGGLNVRAGYRFTSWFATEFLYEWTRRFVYTNTPDAHVVEQQTDSLIANAKLILPFWRVQPYLNLGIGAQKSVIQLRAPLPPERDSAWLFTGRPAFGLDFLAMKHLTVNVELAGVLAAQEPNSISDAAKNLFYLTVGGGLTYRF